MVLFLWGCSSNQNALKSETEKDFYVQSEPVYKIKPGDQLEIKFFYNPELNETVIVRPDGKISLQLIDEIDAAGVEPSILDKQLTERYASQLKRPEITVIVTAIGGHNIYIGGEVARPGLLNIASNITPLQAIFQVGGFRETAEPAETIIIRKGEDNKPVAIRVDLSKALYGSGTGATLALAPSDIVYVPKSAIAEANKFVNQYIEQLLLFRGVSMGFSYSFNDNN
jgi:protein involved in polysaccharide export with SLBB domain